jgi:putrescine aminotransferase
VHRLEAHWLGGPDPVPVQVECLDVCPAVALKGGKDMRAVGDRMIIAPPLVMTHAQIDDLVALILRCLDLTYQEVKKNGWLA